MRRRFGIHTYICSLCEQLQHLRATISHMCLSAKHPNECGKLKDQKSRLVLPFPASFGGSAPLITEIARIFLAMAIDFDKSDERMKFAAVFIFVSLALVSQGSA